MSKRLDQLFSRRAFVAPLLCLLLHASIFSQGSFVAIPPNEASRYRIDFARNFYASPEAEKADRARLYATLIELETMKGKVGASAANLERALQLNDRSQIQLRRHSAYLYLRNAVNTTDETSRAEDSKLNAELDSRTAFLRQELMQLDERQLVVFTSRRPSLKRYLFAIESVRRYRPYTLSPENERLSAAATNNDWQSELYDKLRLQPQAIPAQRDLFAFALTRLAATRTRSTELHHFADAPSAAYFDSYWTRAEVDELMAEVARRSELYKHYQRLRADYFKRGANKNWLPPRYTIDQASEIIRQALLPLGEDYGRELAALLDPANGRMDIVPGEHRKRGGFSKGFVGTDSVFYSAGFAGSYNDLRILTHESTHAVHRQLMNRHDVLPAYAEGPHYLFEAFAIFNEFLLPDYLYNHESDPLRRRFYLERFLEGKGLEIFRVAPEVVVEHSVYDGVRNGTIKGADDLDALSQRVYSRYSIEPGEELKMRWMSISLMYEDPFYDVNYVYGALLALNFYWMYKNDRERFVPRYIALMRNGFDAPPSVLLKRYLDLDLRDPRLVENALSEIKKKIDLIEENYRAEP